MSFSSSHTRVSEIVRYVSRQSCSGGTSITFSGGGGEGEGGTLFRREQILRKSSVLSLSAWMTVFLGFTQIWRELRATHLYMWCVLGKSNQSELEHVRFSVFYLVEVLIWRAGGTFCWKPHLNRCSGFNVMSDWRVLRTIENNRNSFLFLAISHNQCSQPPTDSSRSQHICMKDLQ